MKDLFKKQPPIDRAAVEAALLAAQELAATELAESRAKTTREISTAPTHADRESFAKAARASAIEASEREVAAAKAAVTAANAKREATLAEVDAAITAARVRIEEQIAVETQEALAPLVRAFVADPSRRTAVPIHAALLGADARSTAALGEPLGEHVVVVAFARHFIANNACAVSAFAADQFGHPRTVQVAYDIGRAQSETAERTLRELEELLASIAARSSALPDASAVSRFEAKASRATRAGMIAAVGTHDASIAQQRQRDYEATHRPPARLSGSGGAIVP